MAQKRKTAAEKRAIANVLAQSKEADRVKAASLVFMAYHRDSAWAAHKLQSGTAPLTAESVAYMQQELDARKTAEAYDKKIKAELDAEKPAPNPVGGVK